MTVPEATKLHQDVVTLRGHAQNLLDMGESLGADQGKAALEIARDSRELASQIEEFIKLAVLYQRMQCAPDKAEVMNWLPGSLDVTRGSLDLEIKDVNRQLTAITNQAALSEGETIRNNLRDISQTLAIYSYQ